MKVIMIFSYLLIFLSVPSLKGQSTKAYEQYTFDDKMFEPRYGGKWGSDQVGVDLYVTSDNGRMYMLKIPPQRRDKFEEILEFVESKFYEYDSITVAEGVKNYNKDYDTRRIKFSVKFKDAGVWHEGIFTPMTFQYRVVNGKGSTIIRLESNNSFWGNANSTSDPLAIEFEDPKEFTEFRKKFEVYYIFGKVNSMRAREESEVQDDDPYD